MKQVFTTRLQRGISALRHAVLLAMALLVVDAAVAADHHEQGDLDLLFQNKRSSYVPTSDEVYKKLQPATLKLVIKQYGVPVSVGSAFFVSADGIVITGRSVFRAVLVHPGLTAEFVMSDKKIIKDFKVLDCGDWHSANGLCALKLAVEPKAFFAVKDDVAFTDGASVSAIGHPQGMDFSLARGTLKHTDPHDQKIHLPLTVSGAIGPGNCGAPIYDDFGHLLGVAAVDPLDHPDVRGVIPAAEVRALLDANHPPIPLADVRKQLQEAMRQELHKRVVEIVDPALGFAARSKSLVEMPGFKDVSLVFDERSLKLSLPNVFDDCVFTQKSRESTLHACYAFGDAAVLTVQRMSSKGHENLLAKNGQRLLEPHALSAVDDMIRSDDWSLYEPMLTQTQRRGFFSEPSLAQCQVTRTSRLKGAAFSEIPACRFSVSNDAEPGAYSVNVWLLKDQYLYGIAIWMNDPGLAEYMSRIPILAVLSAHWQDGAGPSVRGLASELKPKPLPNYKIELPETVSFMGAKGASPAQLDLYGKKLLLDQFEDGFIVAVTSEKRAFLPPDFDDVTRRNAGRELKGLQAGVQAKTIEIEPVTIDGQPARLMTGFGKDSKGRDALILSATVFFNDQTYALTEVAVTKDTADTFREFKSLLSGFKRK